MPRDNIPSGLSVYLDESESLDLSRDFETYGYGGILRREQFSVPNELSSMFAEKRAKKNGHKSVDKLLLELKASDEQNLGLRRELNTKTRENEEMKARILYLEEAILELEGK